MFLRKTIVLVFVLACGATGAFAQQSFLQKIELTPFIGVKDGGKINVSQAGTGVDNLLIKSGIEYGGIVDYSIWDNFAFEFMVVQQPSYFSEHDMNTGVVTRCDIGNNCLFSDGTTELTSYMFGGAYTFRSAEAKIRPFAAAGLGWTHFANTNNPPASNKLALGFSNRLAYDIGGGVKYNFARHIGARLDIRYLASRTTPGTAVQCSFFGCFQVATSNHANQLSAAAGIDLRF